MRISDWSSDVCSSDLAYYTDELAVDCRRRLHHYVDHWHLFRPAGRRPIDHGGSVQGLPDHSDPVHSGAVSCYLVGTGRHGRSAEHTSELQSLMRTSYAVLCLKKKITLTKHINQTSDYTVKHI